MATGTTPSRHGIVGSAWRKPSSGKLIEAYDDEGRSFSANIADILQQEWDGRSLVVSASGSTSLAGSFAVHSELVEDNFGWNAHWYGYSEERGFPIVYNEPSCDAVFALTPAELKAIISDAIVRVDGKSITFQSSAKVSLRFLLF